MSETSTDPRRTDPATASVGLTKKLLDQPETCEVLNIGRTKYFELVRERRLRTVTIGRSRRVPIEAIDEFVRSLSNPNEAA